MQLAADGARPSASVSEEFCMESCNLHRQTHFVSSSCVETVSSGASQAVSTELKGQMAPIIIRRQSISAVTSSNNQVLLIFCLVGVTILASKLRPNANAFPQSIISCVHVLDAEGADLKVTITCVNTFIVYVKAHF